MLDEITADQSAAISMVVGTVAIPLGLGALWFAYRANTTANAANAIAQKANEIAEEAKQLAADMVTIEKERDRSAALSAQKANLIGEKIKVATGDHRIVIENKGPGKATNMVVLLDGAPIRQHRSLATAPDHTEVAPYGTIEYRLVLSSTNPGPHDLKITWEDGSGEPGKFHRLF